MNPHFVVVVVVVQFNSKNKKNFNHPTRSNFVVVMAGS